MQFLVTALDGTDELAPQRRSDAREEHLKGAKALKDSGHILEVGPILSDDDKMIGSFILCEFDSRAALEDCLNNDIYSKTGVWVNIDIKPVKVAFR
ncbi:YciI family protein [Dasania sp. GY-MA-18]|uniref:YciI family protein n=1 Tax=Dasania phycosphaerae TaxID=2950436 RepID=A0A9J6RI12_9GAMM|nr:MULTISPECIES: YciI family protein [Dasania]MCR8921557.1 YciI family protein [Dasania sp. GY-MA-18]MCZ0863985.1 YciI family protein [Dasania phycosphaerae]MCZ0867713.1 YciI family protein [Dasania phycosphaerae]